MPQRLLKIQNIDWNMISLNAASVGSLVVTYVTENLTGVGGFILIISIAALNFSKAYINYKKAKKEN